MIAYRQAIRRPTVRRRRQRGVTLIIVLLILVVVTLLGLGSAQMALLGERSTRYDRDYLIASQAAEAALIDAEIDIRGPNPEATSRTADFDPSPTKQVAQFVTNCGTDSRGRGLCMPAPDNTKPVWARVSFLATGATAPTVEFGTYTNRIFQAGPSGVKPDRAPRYIIELVDDLTPFQNQASEPLKMYRITAMGFGPRPDIQVVMQTAFRKEKS